MEILTKVPKYFRREVAFEGCIAKNSAAIEIETEIEKDDFVSNLFFLYDMLDDQFSIDTYQRVKKISTAVAEKFLKDNFGEVCMKPIWRFMIIKPYRTWCPIFRHLSSPCLPMAQLPFIWRISLASALQFIMGIYLMQSFKWVVL